MFRNLMLMIVHINLIRSKKSEIIKLLTFFIGDYYA